MPPKKAAQKGKQGKALKDILPPEIKETREALPFQEIEDGWKDKIHWERTYEPAIVFPEWPAGNDEANKKLEDSGVFKIIEESKREDPQ